jgi:hypothetical protein
MLHGRESVTIGYSIDFNYICTPVLKKLGIKKYTIKTWQPKSDCKDTAERNELSFTLW